MLDGAPSSGAEFPLNSFNKSQRAQFSNGSGVGMMIESGGMAGGASDTGCDGGIRGGVIPAVHGECDSDMT